MAEEHNNGYYENTSDEQASLDGIEIGDDLDSLMTPSGNGNVNRQPAVVVAAQTESSHSIVFRLVDPPRSRTPELISVLPYSANDCSCAIRMAEPTLEQQIRHKIVTLEELQALESALRESLEIILAETELQKVFENVLYQLKNIREILDRSLQAYKRAMSAGFTTNSFDFVHYITAFWHIPPHKLQRKLNDATFYLRFKFMSLERETKVEKWNEEFTKGDRLIMKDIADELQMFSNRITSVQQQAGIA